MTRPAIDGRDGPFSDWLRKQPSLDSVRKAITANDIDMTFLKYRTVVDDIGTRKVKLMMDLEIKTNGAAPTKDQLEVMCFRDHHKGANWYWSTYMKEQVRLYYFGHFALTIRGGERPDVCSEMEWMQFCSQKMKRRNWRKYSGEIKTTPVSIDRLVQLLAFEIAPDTFEPIDLRLRRHHKTQHLYVVDKSGLFPVDRRMIKRS